MKPSRSAAPAPCWAMASVTRQPRSASSLRRTAKISVRGATAGEPEPSLERWGRERRQRGTRRAPTRRVTPSVEAPGQHHGRRHHHETLEAIPRAFEDDPERRRPEREHLHHEPHRPPGNDPVGAPTPRRTPTAADDEIDEEPPPASRRTGGHGSRDDRRPCAALASGTRACWRECARAACRARASP